MLTPGKCMEGYFYLTNSSATCHTCKRENRFCSMITTEVQQFSLSDYFKNIEYSIIDSVKGVLPLGKFPRKLHSFKCRVTLGTEL